MAVSEAQIRASHKYDAKAYDKYGIRFKKGDLEIIKNAAAENGESLNAFIVNAVKDKVARLRKDEEK